jgi:hypothetical protein
MKLIPVIFVSALLTACVNLQAVKDASVTDARNFEPINGVTAGCDSMELTRDCSILNGATKIIEIEGQKLRVASNGSGSIVMIMHDEDECGMTEIDCQTTVNNRNYGLLKEFYSNNGINITAVHAVAAGGVIAGYKLVLDQDGYSVIIN